jgi:hypothetical protein
MKEAKLEDGQEIQVNVPFVYAIGEEGPITGKILKTIEDCENEVRAEFNEGINGGDIILESLVLENIH